MRVKPGLIILGILVLSDTFSHEDLFSLINPILSNDTSVYRRLAGEAEHESEARPHHPRNPRLVRRHELSKLSTFLHNLLELSRAGIFKQFMRARN